MPREKGYTSLPDSNEENLENEGGGGQIESRLDDENSRGVAEPQGSATEGPKRASGATKDAGNDKKSKADLGGLPTAEGVYVGAPVAQSALSYGGGDGGGGAAGGSQTQATVITSTPPSYHAHVVGGAGSGGAAVTAGGHHQIVSSSGGTQHTVILVNPPAHGQWGRGPQPFVCPGCGFSGYSVASTDPCSIAPVLASACCCLVGMWPCFFIPFLIPDLRDTVHRCPSCLLAVGRFRQFN